MVRSSAATLPSTCVLPPFSPSLQGEKVQIIIVRIIIVIFNNIIIVNGSLWPSDKTISNVNRGLHV